MGLSNAFKFKFGKQSNAIVSIYFSHHSFSSSLTILSSNNLIASWAHNLTKSSKEID